MLQKAAFEASEVTAMVFVPKDFKPVSLKISSGNRHAKFTNTDSLNRHFDRTVCAQHVVDFFSSPLIGFEWRAFRPFVWH